MSMIHNAIAITKAQLDFLLTHPEDVLAFLERQDEEEFDECCLHKMWHQMHFLINSHPWEGVIPLGWAVFGGRELGTVDVGYGPARYLLPGQVAELVEALRDLPSERLFEAYDPQAMRDARLYCAPHEGEDDRWIRELYGRLVGFYERTAERGDGALLWLH